MGAAYCMEALAWIAASGRQYERAAVLLGAAAAAASLLRSQGSTLDSNQPMAGYQRDCERQARQALGEMAFQAAYHRGLQLPAEDALAYALQQPDKPPNQPPTSAVPAAPALAAPEPPTPLTSRELQVARLVAGGRSNKEIAAQLVISQRTAEGHVESILTKLGFTSRAQVAVWALPPDWTMTQAEAVWGRGVSRLGVRTGSATGSCHLPAPAPAREAIQVIDTATGVMEPAARSGATDAHAAAAGRAGLIARRELFEQLGRTAVGSPRRRDGRARDSGERQGDRHGLVTQPAAGSRRH